MRGGQGPFQIRRYAVPEFLMFGIYGALSPHLQPMLRGLGYGCGAVGIYSGLFELAGLAGSIFIARRADTLGRYRGTLAAGALAMCFGAVSMALLPSPALTALAIVVMSVGGKTMLPVMDAALINGGEGRRATGRPGFAYGPVRAIGTLGFIAVALILQAWPGFSGSGPLVIALCSIAPVAAFVISLRWMPRAYLPRGEDPAEGGYAGGSRAGEGTTEEFPPSARRRFYLGLAVIALGRFAMSPYTSFFSLYLQEDLRWDAVGSMWSLAAAAEIPMMMAAGFILRKITPLQSIAISSVGVALRLAVMAVFPNPAGVIAGQVLHSISFGFFQPASIAFVALGFPPRRRALGMALSASLGVGLPIFAGSIAGGFVAEAWGYRVLFASFIPFALASVALYLVIRPLVETGTQA